MSNSVLALVVVLATTVVAAALRTQAPTAVELLDRYAGGKFDAAVEAFDHDFNFDDFLKELRRDAPAWIEAGSPSERGRRRLAAATLALEAARADVFEWKWLVSNPGTSLTTLYWKPPPLLIEWGCQLFATDPTPQPIERWWQLAALAVAQRGEDIAFLVGDPMIGRGGGGEIANTQDEIKHLDHVQKRFPDEARFVLAQGVARDRVWEDDATQVYTALLTQAEVAGEAAMRFGALHYRRGRLDPALEMLTKAEWLTRDRYVLYLAAYFKGLVYERKKDSVRASAAFRTAVAAWPDGGQAAAISLATRLFGEGKRLEAQELAARVVNTTQPAFDPYRELVHADDRFWPSLIRRLRAEIAR